MPWKVNGERWHLGEKGFPPGQQVHWDRAILPRLLDLVREIEPDLTIDWDTRDAITLRVPGVSRAWAALRTKFSHALEAKFLGRRRPIQSSPSGTGRGGGRIVPVQERGRGHSSRPEAARAVAGRRAADDPKRACSRLPRDVREIAFRFAARRSQARSSLGSAARRNERESYFSAGALPDRISRSRVFWAAVKTSSISFFSLSVSSAICFFRASILSRYFDWAA